MYVWRGTAQIKIIFVPCRIPVPLAPSIPRAGTVAAHSDERLPVVASERSLPVHDLLDQIVRAAGVDHHYAVRHGVVGKMRRSPARVHIVHARRHDVVHVERRTGKARRVGGSEQAHGFGVGLLEYAGVLGNPVARQNVSSFGSVGRSRRQSSIFRSSSFIISKI